LTRPLSGLRIVESCAATAHLGERLAVMLAGRMAADLGATVAMIEPPSGDPLRTDETDGLFVFLSAGKQSHVIAEGDSAAFQDLLQEADAFIADSFMADSFMAVGASGIGAALPPERPTAMVLVSLLGPDAPHQMPASEFTVMALGGMLDIVGDPTREPLRLGGHQLAYSAGLSALTGLVAALCLPAREADGVRLPEVVEVSLLETAVWLNWKSVAAAAAGEPVPSRSGGSGDWPVVRCADGWVALVYQDADWPGLRKLAGDDPRLDDPALATAAGRRGRTGEIGRIVEEYLLKLSRQEIHSRAMAARLPLGPIASISELVQDPHLVAREFLQRVASHKPGETIMMPRLPLLWNGKALPVQPVPVLEGTQSGASGKGADRFAGSGMPSRPHPARRLLPLAGCRVLDLGIITAGAATSALLADLGAEVIKLESPGYRDPFRFWQGDDAGVDSDLPTFFRFTNRNKSGASLDLKQAAGRNAFLRLVARSDVVVENFRRGVMTRLGIDYEALKAANDGIIFASLSSQGETGPDAGYVSYGTTLEAMAGLAWLTGYADGGPVVSGKDLNYPDQIVAIFAAGMISAAWLQRKRGGPGAHLDLSQRELTAFLAGEAFVAPPETPRRGNAEKAYALQDCFATGDGWVALSVLPEQIATLGSLAPIGADRSALARWLGRMNRDEAARALATKGIAAAPVLDGAEVLAQRGRLWRHALAEGPEKRLAKGFPFQLRHGPLTIFADAPHVGADTARVLGEVGGFSPDEIARLVAAGAAECWRHP
jgi:crotonobetainyl-CoA:carnitine CoA-transferase CaiB-like acyl-CoA transferase